MRKLILLCLILLSLSSFSQSLTSTISYNKTNQQAIMLELPYSQEVSEGFIVSNLKSIGYDPESKGKLFWKNNKVNGFYTFKGVSIQGIPHPVDLYFKVEEKSRRSKDQSIIYLLVSNGDEKFINESDTSTFNIARQLMNDFVTKSAAYKLSLDIKAQEAEIKAAEKKLASQKDKEKDLVKKIEQLQDDLKRNRSDQVTQQTIIENERKKLADLKAKG
jgi:hypothetical protein